MPGKVVRVHVEAGATVEKGAGVIVVEAMKMQNEMKSPRTGVIVTVNVKPGDTVNAGDVLAYLKDFQLMIWVTLAALLLLPLMQAPLMQPHPQKD
jgi:multidrug efflux pump subunit AcrA (membrane-fusion protein)